MLPFGSEGWFGKQIKPGGKFKVDCELQPRNTPLRRGVLWQRRPLEETSPPNEGISNLETSRDGVNVRRDTVRFRRPDGVKRGGNT